MAEEGFKRKLTAILSADAVEYSRLMGEDEEATVRTITAYREVLSTLIQQHNGKVLDSPGDNLLAEFVSVVDAVQCSVAVQKEIKARNDALPENRIMQFRIGINLGDVIQEEERIYGDGVNIAARLEGLAEPGGICVSKTAFDHIESKLPYGYDFLGDQTVKNIAKPIGAYRVLLDPRVTVSGKPLDKKPAAIRQIPVFVGAVVMLIIAVAVGIWQFYSSSLTMAPGPAKNRVNPLPQKPSMAVLPFDNLSNDPEQDYFSDGLTDDLISDLAKIENIFVISRNSTFTYKGKPTKVQEIVKDLNVQYVLEGSVQRSGNQVRIRAQLIDGKTDHHIWSESYDGVLNNIFDLQDEITGEIVKALKIKFDVGGVVHSKKKEAHDVRAYEYFLKGRHHYFLKTKNDFIKAIDIFQKAIEIDPEYSQAYAALALVYWEGSDFGSSGELLFSRAGAPEGVNKNRTLAIKYLNIAMKRPNSIAFAVSSQIRLFKRQYKRAIAEADKAVFLDPTDLAARFALARTLIMSGRSTEALSQIEEILRLDPINPARAYIEFGLAYYILGDLDTAYEYVEKAKIHNLMIGCDIRAIVYTHKGLKNDASMAVSECKPPHNDDIRFRMHQYPFKDKKIAENFASGLYSAGVPGEVTGYNKIYDEYRMSGSEIKNLLINKKVQIFVGGAIWYLEFADNNVCIYTGLQPTKKGRYWFEKDSIWLDIPQLFWGEQCQANVYKNPDGRWEVGNLYFFVSSFGIYPFSHAEELMDSSAIKHKISYSSETSVISNVYFARLIG
jgi:TolB-like protein/class 3 adenylate cyclase